MILIIFSDSVLEFSSNTLFAKRNILWILFKKLENFDPVSNIFHALVMKFAKEEYPKKNCLHLCKALGKNVFVPELNYTKRKEINEIG